MANAKGVDVSHWQALGDWSPVGLTFIVVKASEGTTPDPMYDKHVAKARAAGLIVGAYHFNRDDVDMAAQVATLAAAAPDADLYAIDVEGIHAFTIDQTKDFIRKFKALTHKKIGLYHSESGWFDAGQDWDWVAHWGVSTPSRPWDFHQYRGSPLDLDQFNGTAAEMRTWVAAQSNGGTRVDAFIVPEDFTEANIISGSWVYDNSDLASSSGNIKIEPGRYLRYVGQYSTTPDIRIVGYETAAGDANTTSKAMFIPRSSISSFKKVPDLTPYDQEDIDAAVSVAVTPLEATINEQAAIIAGLKTELALALDSAQSVIVQLEAEISQLEHEVAEYVELREALRRAVAP
jgi:Glycosyl hydrolases family 25